MIKGGCLCGKLRYEYSGEIEEIAMCHCSHCRKAQGGAFATNSPVEIDKLTITGREHIKEYRSNAKKVRAFCAHCGSPVYSTNADLPGICRLRLGTVETEFNCNEQYHIYSESKAVWSEITDRYPRYERGKDA